MTNLISSIPVDAPLWRNTPEDVLLDIILKLSSASYHFADDSGQEWGRAKTLLSEAAALVNMHCLGQTAILALYRHAPQLLGEGQFFDAILKDARK